MHYFCIVISGFTTYSFSDTLIFVGILKNKSAELPVQFVNSNNVFENNPQTSSVLDTSSQMDVDVEPSSSKSTNPNELPEGFFDDPIMDAKVRIRFVSSLVQSSFINAIPSYVG
jgi:hypothetical protein